jgi:RNA polymerase sigma-70 factor, ECF subfamily
MDETGRDLEQELVRAAQNAREGDSRAFEQLMASHQRKILANCRYLTRDEVHYEDLAQEVFVKAFFALKSFEGQSSFGHWLKRIKVNHCLNHMKKRETRDTVAMEDTPAAQPEALRISPEVERILERSDNQQRVVAILELMPAGMRMALVMRDMDDMPYEDIATAMGIGLSAAKMRIKRARDEFRRLFEATSGAAGRTA